MSNHDREVIPILDWGRAVAALALTLIAFPATAAAENAALRPVTALCFKTLGDLGVCTCASHRLAGQISKASMQQYENLIALALAQTNVPRAHAWKTALNRQAIASGTTAQQVQLTTQASGRDHHLAVRQCQAEAVITSK